MEELKLIVRIWHAWTSHGNAEAYVDFLREEFFPEMHQLQGSRGAYLVRRETPSEVEFVALTMWESLEAVRAFAGEDYEQAVVPPTGRKLLSRYDERSAHYETVIEL
jgi:heme-degrading monooxygenase HmoA